MKIHLPLVLVASSLLAIPIAAASSSPVLRGNSDEQQQQHEIRILQEEQVGTFYIKEIEYEYDPNENRRNLQRGFNTNSIKQQRPERTLHVGYDDGTFHEIKNARTGWATKLISGRDRIVIPRGAIMNEKDGSIDVMGLKPTKFSKEDGEEGRTKNFFDRTLLKDDERTPEQERNLAHLHSGRQLTVGTKSLLVVRIIINDGAYNYKDVNGLRDDIFGTGSDLHNIKSQYAACS